jgi:hypothetical protein
MKHRNFSNDKAFKILVSSLWIYPTKYHNPSANLLPWNIKFDTGSKILLNFCMKNQHHGAVNKTENSNFIPARKVFFSFKSNFVVTLIIVVNRRNTIECYVKIPLNYDHEDSDNLEIAHVFMSKEQAESNNISSL